MSCLDFLESELRLGFAQAWAERPSFVLLVSHTVPEVLRMLTFVLIGFMVGGDDLAQYAAVGVAALAVSRATISEVSDIPTVDSWLHVTPRLACGQYPIFLRYTVRAAPFALIGFADAILATCGVCAFLGSFDLMLAILPRLWIVIPALFSGIIFGITVSAAAIGNNYQNLVHNVAASVVTICCGAVFATEDIPLLRNLGQVTPLSHSINALRASLDGRPFIGEVISELVVGVSWMAIGFAVYHLMAQRAKRQGTGAFSN